MMKRITLTAISILILANAPLLAQTGIKFGLKAGYSLGTQYGITPANLTYDVSSASRHGFTGGLILNFPVTEAFSVQQEFLYTQKGSVQDVSMPQAAPSMTEPAISTTSTYNLNYFEMPILFKYNFLNLGKVKFYGSTGFGLSLLLDGTYDLDGTVDMGVVQVPVKESGNTKGLDEFDYSFIYGLGVKFKFYEQDCFFDYRQTIGWNTLMMPTASGGDPAPLRNQTYSFALGLFLN